MDRIISHGNICNGEPCLKGTRIPVWVVLSHFAAGDTAQEIQQDFPKLTQEDIQACFEFAAYLAKERAA